MTCARWLTFTAAAARLNLPVEEVQRLADTKVLHAEWLHHDHWAISEESVTALKPAPELATPTGDVLAAADDEDAMSAHLAHADEPFPAVTWTPWSPDDSPEDREYRNEQADYEPREDAHR
ncbi:hypothetical protein FHR32_005072 [Streptosporangium album]|uniref:Uncharacterized protein n=1 Tax=Streptosporangium album TaxID=47479 RepID=A0A7W7WBV5_9ACTN|nr:hypothetical protein [Streptosporangium album]MBB4940695.1 hypothetical protein [Streptosporangium album]